MMGQAHAIHRSGHLNVGEQEFDFGALVEEQDRLVGVVGGQDGQSQFS